MNVEELSMLGPSVDLETVESIHKKRLLAFVNNFVISTTSFLNSIAKLCEQRFMSLEDKIQKLEASVIILESKLNSVPGLKDAVVEVDVREKADAAAPPTVPAAAPTAAAATAAPASEEMETEKPEEAPAGPERPEISPELLKFVKMLQFGVPAQAVRLKLTQEGVEPSIIEDIMSYNKSS